LSLLPYGSQLFTDHARMLWMEINHRFL
jgi:hypothetical protein